MTATATLPFYTREAITAQCARDHENMPARIVAVTPGHGRHEHSDACGYVPGDRLSCMKDCDDSDAVVELRYVCPDGPGCYVNDRAGHEHGAVYGVLDGRAELWQD